MTVDNDDHDNASSLDDCETSEDIIVHTGWNQQTVICLYDSFVEEQGLGDAFRDFLMDRARQEEVG